MLYYWRYTFATYIPMNDQQDLPDILASDVEKVARKIFFGLTAMVVFIVPLLVARQFFFPFIVPRSVFFMITVNVLVINWAVLHYLNPKKYRIDFKNPILIAAGGLLLVWTISGIFGADWTLSFWSTYQRMTGILLLLHLTMWLTVSTAVLRGVRIWKWLLGIFSLTGVIVSAYTIFGPHGFSIFTGLDLSRGGATIGNTSFLGTYVLFTFFATLLLLVQEGKKSKRLRIYGWTALFLMTFSPAIFNFGIFSGELPLDTLLTSPQLVLGQARAVAASLFIGLVFAGGLWLLRQRQVWKKAVGGLLSVGILLSSMIALVMLFTPGTQVREAFGDMAARARFLTWNESIQAFSERPLLGWGPESFDLLHQRLFDPLLYVDAYGGELWFDRAHNIVIDTMVSTGMLGLLMYALIFAAFFLVVFRLRKLGRVSDAESAILGGLMFAYLLQAMTVFDMTVSYVAFFFILMYVASKLPRRDKASLAACEEKEIIWKSAHGAIAVAAMVLIFATSTRILNASWSISRSLVANTPQERMELYDQAFGFQAGRTLFLRTVSTRMYDSIRQKPELLNPQSAPAIRAEAEFFEQALLYEAEKRPYNYRAYVTAAKMAQLRAFMGETGKIQDAIDYSNKAIAIAPQNAMAYLTLGELYTMLGEYGKAREVMDIMLATSPDSTFLQDAHFSSLLTLKSLESEGEPQE